MANEEALPTVRGSGAGGGGVRLRHPAPGTRLASGCASRVLYIFLLQRRRLVKGKDVRGGGGSGRRVSRDLWGTLARSVALVQPPPGFAREVGGNLRGEGREGVSLGTSGTAVGTLGAGRPSCEGSGAHSTASRLLPLSPRGVTCARRELTIGDISQRAPKDQASMDVLGMSTGQSARGSGSECCRGLGAAEDREEKLGSSHTPLSRLRDRRPTPFISHHSLPLTWQMTFTPKQVF